MPRHYVARAPGKRTYVHYTGEILEKALDESKEGKISLREASRKYSIPVGTLSHKIRGLHTKKQGGQLVFNEAE